MSPSYLIGFHLRDTCYQQIKGLVDKISDSLFPGGTMFRLLRGPLAAPSQLPIKVTSIHVTPWSHLLIKVPASTLGPKDNPN